MRLVTDTSLKKIKTHILYPIRFSENRDFCEVMWKNMLQPDRPQMAVLRRKDSLCMPNKRGKNTDIHNI
jgi:hypothetical protein